MFQSIVPKQMDSEWISRLAAAKRHFAIQHNQSSRLDRFGIEDFEVEEDCRAEFSCPYCYEDHDVTSLCIHLEDEHAFESKVAVCPICSHKITRDMLNHIRMQHGHLLKVQRHRRLRRVAVPNSQALPFFGRDLREAHLQVLLGNGGFQSNNTSATDSLLSSLVLNFPSTESEETQKCTMTTVENLISKKAVPSLETWNSNVDKSLSYEEREQKRKQDVIRAAFMQDMLLTTLIMDQ